MNASRFDFRGTGFSCLWLFIWTWALTVIIFGLFSRKRIPLNTGGFLSTPSLAIASSPFTAPESESLETGS